MVGGKGIRLVVDRSDYLIFARNRGDITIRSITLICVVAFLGGWPVANAQDLPWVPQYKRGGTPADVAGPDGIIYPNWAKVGVQGGIPAVKAFAAVEQYGATANDHKDDSVALQTACDAAGRAGGGAVILGEGTYQLDQKTVIKYNGTVIRGQGADRTRLIVRYNEQEDSKSDGIILFTGQDALSEHALIRDAKRGSTRLALKSVDGLKEGTWLRLHAPATQEWRKLAGGVTTPWDQYRLYMVRVENVEHGEVSINQPVRIDFPCRDGSKAYRMEPISGCGVEDFSITQAQKPPKIQTILFKHAVNCWAKGIRVDMTGRNPVYAMTSKWITIKDCEFNGSWDCGGGGTGYVGFEGGWDCLMENVKSTDMRHAPCLEWGSSGCVIRNSTFINSDAQCHSGWCHENLFENCVVVRPSLHSSNGHGFYTTSPTDRLHGPIGPRNVIYNCDFAMIPGSGLVLSGMNENWIVLYNRFDSRSEGIACLGVNFDHVIAHNVFVVRDSHKSMVVLETPYPYGIEVKSNRLYGGNGLFLSGNAQGAVAADNTAHSLVEELPPRPKPAVPSIYEWQQKEMPQTHMRRISP